MYKQNNMSIATLKRKTQTQYNNMSVGAKTGFSLNGGYRNLSYIGQTALSNHYPRTLMNGNVVRGHGGCCGTYVVSPIVQSGIQSYQDNSVVKPSVLNTRGMLTSRFRWITRPQPFATVKPDSNQNLNDASDRTEIMKNASMISTAQCNASLPVNATKAAPCQKCSVMKTPDYPPNTITKPLISIVKPDKYISQDEYLQRKKFNCSSTQNQLVGSAQLTEMNKIYTPLNTCGIAFACGN